MNEIIYMKAGYEPWWMFSGWESILSKSKYELQTKRRVIT